MVKDRQILHDPTTLIDVTYLTSPPFRLQKSQKIVCELTKFREDLKELASLKLEGHVYISVFGREVPATKPRLN